MEDWETVKEDGSIKRYPVPGGWIYGVWAFENIYGSDGRFIDSCWRMIAAFHIPTNSPPTFNVTAKLP